MLSLEYTRSLITELSQERLQLNQVFLVKHREIIISVDRSEVMLHHERKMHP